MAKLLVYWLSFLTSIWLPNVLGFPGGDGWEWMRGTADLDGAQFMDFAYPLVEMSANAYRYPGALHPIPGWSVSPLIAPLHPPGGGVHALVFAEDPSVACRGAPQFAHNTFSADMDPDQLEANPYSALMGPAYGTKHCGGRVIVSFRGTQMSSSIDSVADICADKLLWEGFDLTSLPEECLVFEPKTLDYFSQALNYTLQVMSLYPFAPVLLTGHSLGAGLAVLVAGALSHTHTLHVIGFGTPGTRKALLDRGLSIKPLDNDSIVAIGHEWDVIMRTQMEGQVGLLCFYPQVESTACKACISSVSLPLEEVSAFSVQNIENELMPTCKVSTLESSAKLHRTPGGIGGLPPGDCTECFFETHYLKNLIDVVKQGEKPVCQQASYVNVALSNLLD